MDVFLIVIKSGRPGPKDLLCASLENGQMELGDRGPNFVLSHD